jgi:hypothetical protein
MLASGDCLRVDRLLLLFGDDPIEIRAETDPDLDHRLAVFRHSNGPMYEPTYNPRTARSDIHLTVSAPVFDALEVLAKQKCQSVQDLIRRSIRHLLDNERRGSV